MAVGTTALGLTSLICSPARAAPKRASANDRLTIACIGVGGRGTSNLNTIANRAATATLDVAAVCDVDETRLARALARAGSKASAYRDYRYILERKDIDAVVISTPDHWHAVGMVHAAECGKHVYVEKPACCTIEEGVAMVKAARDNRVCVQVGSQGRSQPGCYHAHRYIANGNIGRVTRVACWHYASPADTKPVPDSAPPDELDWDLWLGPLPWRPYNARYCPGTFRWVMESGGGQIRDRGAHVMSNVLWIMGADRKVFASPRQPAPLLTVEATGTVPTRGLWDTAVTMDAIFHFREPDWTLEWSQPGVRIAHGDREPGRLALVRDTYGALYQGTHDSLVLWGGDSRAVTESKAMDWMPGPGAKDVQRSPGFDHFTDWFEAIRTARDPIMNIEAGVATAYLTVLANLSLVLGRKLTWDPTKREIVGDEAARRLMSRPQRHPYVL